MTKFLSLGERTGADQGMADFMKLYGFDEVGKTADADIIIFNGGADIGTSIYHQDHYRTGDPGTMSKRDQQEINIFRNNQISPYGHDNTKPRLMLGICRGAQLINCLSGGSLWQDVNNHGTDHSIKFSLGTDWRDEPDVIATSTHHQQMVVGNHGQLIAYTDISTYKNGQPIKSVDPTGVDAEIVWYPRTGALCIQGHPEYNPSSDFSKLCVKLINHYYELIVAQSAVQSSAV